MEKLLEGLRTHEIIMMVLGIVLFLVLVYCLIYSLRKDQPVKGLALFFLLPIVMIGFSGIKKVSFMGTLIDMRSTMAIVEEQSDNAEARAELEAQLLRLEKADNLQSVTLATIARGMAAKGDSAATMNYLAEAVAKWQEE